MIQPIVKTGDVAFQLIEATIHLFKALVNLDEALVNLFESQVRSTGEVVDVRPCGQFFVCVKADATHECVRPIGTEHFFESSVEIAPTCFWSHTLTMSGCLASIKSLDRITSIVVGAE